MKATALTFLLGAFVIFPAGCNKDDGSTSKTSGSGTIGSVDLDRVGKAMGWNDEMQKNLDQTKAQIEGQLKGYLKYRADEFETKKKEIAKAAGLSTSQIEQLEKVKQRSDLEKLGLNAAQIDELGQAAAAVNNEAARAQQQLNQIVQQQNQKIVKAYQDAAQPAIRRVALANNRQVIVQPVGALYTDPQIDLTDKVVDDLQHSTGSKVDLPPIPKLDIQFPDKAK